MMSKMVSGMLFCIRMSHTISIQNNTFSFDEIKSGQQKDMQWNENDRATLDFCRRWLNGGQEFYFHTSGSTGTPKQIVASREQMKASAHGTIEALQISPADHIWICLQTSVIGGAMMLVRGLESGADITITEPSADPLKTLAADHPYTFASFVPLQLQDLLQPANTSASKLERFNNILVGGGALNILLEDACSVLQTQMYHTYGMTETLSHVALRKIGKDRDFKCLPGIKIRQDERECLCIKGVVTNGEWLVTNDVVELTGEHSFLVKGRTDDMINTGGVKVFAPKVEDAAYEVMNRLGMRDVSLFVYAVPDVLLGQKITLFIEGEQWNPLKISEAKKEMMETLGRYEIPRAVVFIPSFLKTASGKINRRLTAEKAIAEQVVHVF